MTKTIELKNMRLPKWPHMVVWGTPVTQEQAKDIIFRTDAFLTHMSSYAGGNNHAWNAWANQTLGREALTAQ